MQIREVMRLEVETIRPDAPLQAAAQKMASFNIGILPVMEEDKIVGAITDRDITIRATAKGLDPAKTKVREAMTEVVICGFEDQDIHEAARLMMDNQVRRLPILDREHSLVGLVSLGDLALAVEDKMLAGQILESICEPQSLRSKEQMATR